MYFQRAFVWENRLEWIESWMIKNWLFQEEKVIFLYLNICNEVKKKTFKIATFSLSLSCFSQQYFLYLMFLKMWPIYNPKWNPKIYSSLFICITGGRDSCNINLNKFYQQEILIKWISYWGFKFSVIQEWDRIYLLYW